MFKYRDGIAPNLLAIGYVILGHAAGLVLLFGGSAARLAGVALVAHTLVLSTYLLHECMHETLFTSRPLHARLGALLAWANGGRYAGYDRLQRKHLHHHLDRSDPITVDFREALAGAPAAIRRSVVVLESSHLPVLEIWLRMRSLILPWSRPALCGERRRVLAVLASRILAAGVFCWLSPAAFALYALAATVAIVVERFLDAFHHTFELEVLPSYDAPFGPARGRDRVYEQENTFSTLLSESFPATNLLFLNFPYHNAHHAKPGTPWHRLPELDRRLYGDDRRQVLPLGGLLGAFHRHRKVRLLGPEALPDLAPADPRLLGAAGVSLLTP